MHLQRLAKAIRRLWTGVASRDVLRTRRSIEPLEARCQLAGTPFLVADIRPGPSSSMPDPFQSQYSPPYYAPVYFTSSGGDVYFGANDGVHGLELWRSNATRVGTQLVKDILPNAQDGLASRNLASFNDRIYFTALQVQSGLELWSSDGTAGGTQIVKDIWPGPSYVAPADYTVADGLLYFIGDDGEYGRELWKTDGTADGTALVRDISPDTSTYPPRGPHPQILVDFHDRLYFSAAEASTGWELWRSDGTTAGTSLVLDLTPGSYGSNIENSVVSGGLLYFTGEHELYNDSLWRTDGAPDGTILLLPGGSGSQRCDPENLTDVQGTLFFSCRERAELWTSDGTVAGTVLVSTFPDTDDEDPPESLTAVGNRVYFTVRYDGGDQRLFISDGTAAGTRLVRSFITELTSLYNADGVLYFVGYDIARGRELWTTDGTTTGTRRVADIHPGSGDSVPRDFFYHAGRLYFTASDGVHGRELWALSTSPAVPGDLNFDGLVSAGDLAVLVSNLGHTSAVAEHGDIDSDGRVGLKDVLRLRELMQPTAAAAAILGVSRNDAVRTATAGLDPARRLTAVRTARRFAAVDSALSDEEAVAEPMDSGRARTLLAPRRRLK